MPHLVKLYGTSTGARVSDPMPTITANDRGGGHIGEVRAFLMKYYGQGVGQDLNEPAHTVTTKERFALVTVRGVRYQIVDIGMRMLTPRELFRAQGFPEDYIIDGLTKTEQINKCGNAVPPHLSAALVRANVGRRAA